MSGCASKRDARPFEHGVYLRYLFGPADALMEEIHQLEMEVFELRFRLTPVTAAFRRDLLQRESRLREGAGRMLKPGHYRFEDLDKVQAWILELPAAEAAPRQTRRKRRR